MIEPIARALSTASIVVVVDDELDLNRLVARLVRRYGTDYDVIGVHSGTDAMARLSNLRDRAGGCDRPAPRMIGPA